MSLGDLCPFPARSLARACDKHVVSLIVSIATLQKSHVKGSCSGTQSFVMAESGKVVIDEEI